MTYKNAETVGSTATTIYTARAQRFFNGEVIRVQSDGQICGMTFPSAAERTNPPSFTVQQVSSSPPPAGRTFPTRSRRSAGAARSTRTRAAAPTASA